jgi:hypothetical protein
MNLRNLTSATLLWLCCTPLIAGTLPEINAEDLNGKPYSLPQGLPAQKTLLLIAYKREQQEDINTWISGLNLKTASTPWLELPVLEDYGSWFKWFVDNGMRKGIKSEFDRAKVVTVYTSKESFNNSMGINTEESIHAAVVDRNGNVITLESGRFTEQKAEKLMAILTQTTTF